MASAKKKSVSRGQFCSAIGCTNSFYKEDCKGKSFFTFPRDERGCVDGILVDLSEPGSDAMDKDFGLKDKENFLLLTDSIEISRRDSIASTCTLDAKKQILQDITDRALGLQQRDAEVPLIEDEIFDFDLPLSSPEMMTEKKDDEMNLDDEIFFGPIGFTEKCIAAGITDKAIQPLSPLRPDQLIELKKEAYSIASRIAKAYNITNRISNMEISDSARAHASMSYQETKCLSEKPEEFQTLQIENGLHSVQQQKCCDSVTVATDMDDCLTSPETEHQRKKSFIKEEPVQNLLSACPKESGVQEKKSSAGSKLLRPKSTRPVSSGLMYSNSQPALTLKPPVPETVTCKEKTSNRSAVHQQILPAPRRSLQPPRAPPVPETVTCKEKTSNRSAVHQQILPAPRRSLQPPRAGKMFTRERQRRTSGDSTASSSDGSVSGANSKLPIVQPSIRRAHSMISKTISHKPTDKSVITDASKKSSRLSTGPATKSQLLQPSKLKGRLFASGLVESAVPSQRKPMKVPVQPQPKMGGTVERPYNPALAAAAKIQNQCPVTPVGQKKSQPKVLSMSSDSSTPARSSCSSGSVLGSTPGSVNKRLSLIPTPSKRSSSTNSMPPPSPLSLNSNNSCLSRRSVASTSDAASVSDSPVFDPKITSKLLKSSHPSGLKECSASSDVDAAAVSPFVFKTRQSLVQNTPDVPKRSQSRWSPVIKNKPALLEDQVLMCTKRVTPN